MFNYNRTKLFNFSLSVQAIVAQSNHLHAQVSTKFKRNQEGESRIVSRVVSINLFDQTTGEEIFNLEQPVEIVFDTLKVMIFFSFMFTLYNRY